MNVIKYNSIREVNKFDWDFVADYFGVINSYDNLKAVEESKINNFKYIYYIFYNNNTPIAIASTFVITYEMDYYLEGFIKKIINNIRKKYANFLKLVCIECGPTTAIGPAFITRDKSKNNEIIELFCIELSKLKKEYKAKLFLIRDFEILDRLYTSKFIKYGFIFSFHFFNTFFKIKFTSFDEYINSLRNRRRREVKSNINKFKNNGFYVEKIIDFSSISHVLSNLWHNTHKNYDLSREILNENYFKFISEYLKNKSFVITIKKDNEIIGFALMYDDKEILRALYLGLNYQYAKEYKLYFIIYYSIIDEAIKLQKKWIEFGISTYDVKSKMGCCLVPSYIYIKFGGKISTKLFALIFRITAEKKYINFVYYNTYNIQKIQKEKLSSKLYAYYNDKKIKIVYFNDFEKIIQIDNTLCELRNIKKIMFIIKTETGFSMKIKCELKQITERHITYKIINIDKKFLFLYNSFIMDYEM